MVRKRKCNEPHSGEYKEYGPCEIIRIRANHGRSLATDEEAKTWGNLVYHAGGIRGEKVSDREKTETRNTIKFSMVKALSSKIPKIMGKRKPGPTGTYRSLTDGL